MSSEVIFHEKTTDSYDLMESLTHANAAGGKGLGAMVMEIAQSAIGPGKVKPQEYFFFRMHDASLSAAQRAAFAGRRIEAKNNFSCNYNRHLWAVAEDKLVYQAVLSGMGLPVPELVALYHKTRSYPGVDVLRTPLAMADWLRSNDAYPFFGKPNDMKWSVGVSSLSSYDSSTDEVVTLFDKRMSVDEYAAQLGQYADKGYLLQRRLTPHPILEEMAGPALPTLRVIVAQDTNGPRILRVHIKLPTGHQVADNTWRGDNIIALVHPETGLLERTVSGNGSRYKELTTHPDTGKPITGVQLPHWSALRDVVLEASNSLPGLCLLGWDVALCEQGPVLVEVNVDPDWTTHQGASQQGMLTPDFMRFVEHCTDTAKKDEAQRKQQGLGA